MLCGTHRDRGLYRVVKANEAVALALPGAQRMTMGTLPMPGMVRERLMALALDFVGGLPPK